MSELKMVQGSVEYLYADIRADRVLDTQAVQIAISQQSPPLPEEWTAAVWTGPVAKYRSARVLLDGTLPKGLYNVFIRIQDLPEAPIIPVGKLRII